MSAIEAWVRQKFAQVELFQHNLHDYQNAAYDFLYKTPFSALFLDTGLGKTPTLLRLFLQIVTNHECENILVIGPRRVVEVTWPDEIAKWHFAAPLTYTIIREEVLTEAITKAGQAVRRRMKVEQFGADCVAEAEARARKKAERDALKKGHGPEYVEACVKAARVAAEKGLVAEARLAAARKAVRQMMRERPASVFLIHKEQVEFLVDAFGRDWPFDVVVIDESSALKDHTTNRWKALWRVRPLIKRMHQLTATPAAESYRHLFAQITLLDMGTRLGKSFNKFSDKYFSQNKYTMKWAPRDGAVDEITEKISDICLVMKQEDYLDLQQPVLSPHYVHLDSRQMDLYRQMENDFIVELDDGTEVEAETAAALSQKLLQMASGVLYNTVLDEVGPDQFKKRREVHQLHDHKIDALAQLREEINGETMLVAYYHQSSLDRILKAFPDARAMDKAGTLIKEWNAGKIPMFLIHPQSDAHGLNLQRGGRHVVFFDLPFSYEQYYQLYRRLARQGQELLVVIHQLIARGTRDEDVAAALVEKGDVQEVFFKLIMKMRRRRAQERRQSFALDEL